MKHPSTLIAASALILTSCASLRQSEEAAGIQQFAAILSGMGEPTDIRSVTRQDLEDTYIRLLFLPSHGNAPICVTVRYGGLVSGVALIRTQILQAGRGEPYTESYDPDYTRLLYSSDSVVDTESFFDLRSRILDASAGITETERRCLNARGILDGETYVIEYVNGTNDYCFLEVHQPEILDERFKTAYTELWPDKPVDFEHIQDFLLRTMKVIDWFRAHTTINQFRRYVYKEKASNKTQEGIGDSAEPSE